MELTFLGTGAGESYPGLWCRCPHCDYARKKGGRNIRANSCAVLDGKVLLDMGPMCFDTAARLGIDLTQVTTLLITHPHPDHLYMQHLHWREVAEEHLGREYREQLYLGGPRFTPLPELKVYGNAYTEKTVSPILEEKPSPCLTFHRITEGEAFETDGYTVMPIRGNHHEPGFAHSYVIQKDGACLLYALDTCMYDPDMMDLLYGYVFDTVIMEGTTGLNELAGGHMSLARNRRFREDLLSHGCLRADSRFYLTHLSPHWCPPHDFYSVMVEPYGFRVAYDGLTIGIGRGTEQQGKDGL